MCDGQTAHAPWAGSETGASQSVRVQWHTSQRHALPSLQQKARTGGSCAKSPLSTICTPARVATATVQRIIRVLQPAEMHGHPARRTSPRHGVAAHSARAALHCGEELRADHADLVDEQHVQRAPARRRHGAVHLAEVRHGLRHAAARLAVQRGAVDVRSGDAGGRRDGHLLSVHLCDDARGVRQRRARR